MNTYGQTHVNTPNARNIDGKRNAHKGKKKTKLKNKFTQRAKANSNKIMAAVVVAKAPALMILLI